MTPEEKRLAADAVLNVPFFRQLLDDMERQAVDACVSTKNSDHENRLAYAIEVRMIRKIRRELEALSKDGNTGGGRSAPA